MGLTEKREKFVQGLFKGLSQRKAYREAYPKSIEWKDSAVDSRACVLSKNEKILERLEELRNDYTQKSNWTLNKLIDEFEIIKEKCLQEIPVEVYNKHTREYEETGEYVFKEHGAIKSLENIGKLLGYYKEDENKDKNLEININVNLEDDDND